MVFGFGEGKLEIVLERSSFAPGEKISGKIIIATSGDKNADSLNVKFCGKMKTVSISTSMVRDMDTNVLKSAKQTDVTIKEVYPAEARVGGKQTYSKGAEIPFEIQIPSHVLDDRPGEGGNVYTQEPKWFVRAWLALPMSKDIEGEKEVYVEVKRRNP